MNVAQTHRTVRARYILDALVPIGAQLYRQAHVAHLTVEEIAATAQPTDAAAVTVVLVLGLVVEQIADQARVPAKADAALFALGLHLLAGVALRANELGEGFAVEVVLLVLVVTVATLVELAAARRLERKRTKKQCM